MWTPPPNPISHTLVRHIYNDAAKEMPSQVLMSWGKKKICLSETTLPSSLVDARRNLEMWGKRQTYFAHFERTALRPPLLRERARNKTSTMSSRKESHSTPTIISAVVLVLVLVFFAIVMQGDRVELLNGSTTTSPAGSRDPNQGERPSVSPSMPELHLYPHSRSPWRSWSLQYLFRGLGEDHGGFMCRIKAHCVVRKKGW